MSRLVIDTQHVDFYQKEGFLELEELISFPLYERLSLDLLKVDDSLISKRYLSRKFPSFKKLSENKTIQSLALELSSKPFLKYGLDRLITKSDAIDCQKPIYFRQLFSYTAIAMGLFINLSPSPIKRSTFSPLFPTQPRSATFFKATQELDFSCLEEGEKQLLITFCFTDSRYKLNSFDIFSHDVKKENSSFGDKLSERFHPFIYK